MRTAAYNDDVASGLRSTSVVAKRASQALSNALGARMCQGTFYLCILKYDVFVFVQRICKDQSEYTTGNHFADTYRQHHERNW